MTYLLSALITALPNHSISLALIPSTLLAPSHIPTTSSSEFVDWDRCEEYPNFLRATYLVPFFNILGSYSTDIWDLRYSLDLESL